MPLTNKRCRNSASALKLAVCLSSAVVPITHAEPLHWSTRLSPDERSCLDDLIRTSNLADSETEEFRRLTAAARVSLTHLDRGNEKAYIYLLDDIGWCGSAGCALLIGERQAQNTCKLLYNGSGWYTARVLGRGDHGYRRLYLPCEVRFDGRQYQQIHEECPNANVTR